MFLLCAKSLFPCHIACIVEQGKNLIFCLLYARLDSAKAQYLHILHFCKSTAASRFLQ